MDYEEIASKIASYFYCDFELQAYEIIIKSKPATKIDSPVLYVEHHLGIESWCIKDLYVNTYKNVFSTNSDSSKFEPCLLTALILNHQTKTLWNMRRNLLLNQKLELNFELHFCRVVICSAPKAQEAYNYRKWLIKSASREQINFQFAEKELELILTAAKQHENNHIAWDYAIWLFDIFPEELLPSILINYWKKLQNWIDLHVSDYSSLHFRQFLLKKLLNLNVKFVNNNFKKDIICSSYSFYSDIFDGCDNIELFYQESESDNLFFLALILTDVSFNESLILFYENHEALWVHRRHLFYYFSIVSKLYACNTFMLPTLMRFFNCDKSDLFYIVSNKIHKRFIEKLKNTNNNVFLDRYLKWLKIFDLSFDK